MNNSFVENNSRNYVDTIGWLLSAIVPVITYFTLLHLGVSLEIVIFLSSLSSAIVMWIFRIVPEYLPGILVIISCAALGLLPTNIVMSGFSSETFVMIFSVLAITVLIARSKLIPRFILTLLNILPKKQKYFDFVFFISFVFMTPLIPSIASRTYLVGRSINSFIEILDLKTNDDSITRLTANAFFGASLFSNTFLSSSLMNFVILALLPLQEQLEFQLVGWLEASAVAFFSILISYLMLFYIFFKRNSSIKISKELIAKQLNDLGPISKDEWLSLVTIAIFFIGMVTFPYHKIAPAWVAFALTYALLTFNILNREEIMSKIDWPFLLFMAAVIGISSITNYFGIAEVISQKLQNFTLLFGDSQGILFIFFVVFNIAIRFFLPIGATIALLIPIFISLAGLYTITAWAACFTCLIITDMWFFPYQCIFYTSMKTVFEEANVSFGEKKFLMFNALANIVRILAILASFYYWQWLGLL